MSSLWVKPSFKTNAAGTVCIFCATLPVAPVCSSWTFAGLSKTSVRQKQGDDSSTSLCCLRSASQPCPNGTQWRQQVAVLLVGTGGHRAAVTPGPGKPQPSQHPTVPEEPINKSQAQIYSRNTFGIDDAGAMQQTATYLLKLFQYLCFIFLKILLTKAQHVILLFDKPHSISYLSLETHQVWTDGMSNSGLIKMSLHQSTATYFLLQCQNFDCHHTGTTDSHQTASEMLRSGLSDM